MEPRIELFPFVPVADPFVFSCPDPPAPTVTVIVELESTGKRPWSTPPPPAPPPAPAPPPPPPPTTRYSSHVGKIGFQPLGYTVDDFTP